MFCFSWVYTSGISRTSWPLWLPKSAQWGHTLILHFRQTRSLVWPCSGHLTTDCLGSSSLSWDVFFANFDWKRSENFGVGAGSTGVDFYTLKSSSNSLCSDRIGLVVISSKSETTIGVSITGSRSFISSSSLVSIYSLTRLSMRVLFLNFYNNDYRGAYSTKLNSICSLSNSAEITFYTLIRWQNYYNLRVFVIL